MNMDLIFDKYPKELLPFDFETYFNSEINCQIVTTNCLTGKAEYMTEDSDNDRLMKLCRASSSMPLLTPIVNIDNVPYLDGGLADSVPIRRAQQMENEKIVVILTKNQGYRKSVLSPTIREYIKRAYKSYPNLIRTIFRRSFEYNKTMNYLDQLEKRGEIFILRPQVKPVSRLERNKETLHAFYEHGYKYTERSLMILWNIWKIKAEIFFTINETIVYKMRNVGKSKRRGYDGKNRDFRVYAKSRIIMASF